MNLDKDLEAYLDRYFDKYSISRISGGATDAKLYRLETADGQSFIVKSQVASLKNDYLNYKWLDGKVPVPKLVFYDQLGQFDLLCMTELKGHPLEFYIAKIENREIVRRYANSLKRLHTVNITCEAPVQDLDKRILAAEENLASERVDRSQLQPEYQHYDLRELFNKLVSIKPTNFELVFTHGDYCLDNIIFDDEVLSGFIDIGNGGVADKYQDLALAVRSIKDSLGYELVDVFYEEYGLVEVNKTKLEFYAILDEFF